MENNENMCYITYAVPKDSIPFPFFKEREKEDTSPKEPVLFPPGFVPEWYLKGCFPEDDI